MINPDPHEFVFKDPVKLTISKVELDVKLLYPFIKPPITTSPYVIIATRI